MPDPRTTDLLITVALYGVPVVCSLVVGGLALRRGTDSRLSRFMFLRIVGVSVPLSVLLGVVADRSSAYEVSAGMLMLFYAPPLALVVSALATGITGWLLRRRGR